MRRLPALLLAALGCAFAQVDPEVRASDLAAQGRWSEAAVEIERAVEGRPDDLALRVDASRMHGEAGNVDRAVEHVQVAIEGAPRHPDAWIQLGVLEQRRTNVADAYVAFRRATELAPDDVRAVSGLALTADALGFEDEARAAYARWSDLAAP